MSFEDPSKASQNTGQAKDSPHIPIQESKDQSDKTNDPLNHFGERKTGTEVGIYRLTYND